MAKLFVQQIKCVNSNVIFLFFNANLFVEHDVGEYHDEDWRPAHHRVHEDHGAELEGGEDDVEAEAAKAHGDEEHQVEAAPGAGGGRQPVVWNSK